MAPDVRPCPRTASSSIPLMPLWLVHLARLCGLVRHVEAFELSGLRRGREWTLRVEGRGFRALVDDGGAFHTFHPYTTQPTQPMRFITRSAAERFARASSLHIR